MHTQGALAASVLAATRVPVVVLATCSQLGLVSTVGAHTCMWASESAAHSDLAEPIP